MIDVKVIRLFLSRWYDANSGLIPNSAKTRRWGRNSKLDKKNFVFNYDSYLLGLLNHDPEIISLVDIVAPKLESLLLNIEKSEQRALDYSLGKKMLPIFNKENHLFATFQNQLFKDFYTHILDSSNDKQTDIHDSNIERRGLESKRLRAYTFYAMSKKIKLSDIMQSPALSGVKDLHSKLRTHLSKWENKKVSESLQDQTREFIKEDKYLSNKGLHELL